MTKVDFSASRKKAEEAGLLGDGPWKPKEGPNRIRLVSECLEHPGEYTDKSGKTKKTFKWLCFILDRATNAVKPYFMPNVVYEQIEALQLDQDYVFDEVPMPYDLTLNVKNAGKLEVDYIIIPSPNRVPLTQGELATIAEVGSIREYQKTVYENQKPANEQQVVTETATQAPMPEPPPVPDRYDNIPPEFRPTATGQPK